MQSTYHADLLDILARLSKHLDHLSEQVFDSEEQLGELLSSTSHLKPVAMGFQKPVAVDKIQSLDFVRQSLEDCALLLHCLSHQPNEKLEPNLFLKNVHGKMKLNTTQNLVIPKNDASREAKSPGSIDLF